MSESPTTPRAIGLRLDSVFGRLTNEEVAERLSTAGQSVSKETVRRYRSGDAERMAVDFVADVARVFGVDPSWLLTGTGQPPANAPRRVAIDPRVTDEELAELYRRIDAIEAEDTAPWLKVLRVDALASAVRAEAMRMAEKASAERAAAIRTAEEGAAERARAAGAEAEAALSRTIALKPEAATEAPTDEAKRRAAELARTHRGSVPPASRKRPRAAGE